MSALSIRRAGASKWALLILILTAVLLALSTAEALAAVGDFLGKWGSGGTGEGQFDWPAGVAIAPNGDVYVADMYNMRIQYFGSDGAYKGQWGSYGTDDAQFADPVGIAIAPNGDVYVADMNNHRIQYFGPTGAFKGKWGSQGGMNGQFESPWGVAVALNGDVYVADTSNHRVQYFGPDGTYKGQWGSLGTGDGQFNQALEIAINCSGDVYVTDRFNYRVQYFGPGGTYKGQWGALGSGAGDFQSPSGIAVAPDGDVYVADSSQRIQHFGPDGTYKGEWGSGGSVDAQFDGPFGIATASNGRVYVVDMFNNRVQYFDGDGWVDNSTTGSSYLFVEQPKNWRDAEDYANDCGGHLVTVNDADESAWLAATYLTHPLWIGLNDIDEEGNWVWSSGEPVTYTNWAPGEPNAYGDDEDAADWWPASPGWYDSDVNELKRFVVEKDPAPLLIASGTVTIAATSQPVENAFVEAERYDSDTGIWELVAMGFTDEQGVYEVYDTARKGAGDYRFTAGTRGYSRQTKAETWNGMYAIQPLDFALQPAPVIAIGTVKDAVTGEGIEGATVMATCMNDEGRAVAAATAESDESGICTFYDHYGYGARTYYFYIQQAAGYPNLNYYRWSRAWFGGSPLEIELEIAPNPSAADGYEPDDTAAQAKPISPKGLWQEHSTWPAGDGDWTTFDAEAGSTYVIETTATVGVEDTYVYVYDSDGTTLLASNDDSPAWPFSRIEWTASADKKVYVVVRNWDAVAGVGFYGVRVDGPNAQPVAGSDAYIADCSRALVVAAPGVLGNDSDPDGYPLTAVKVTGPVHGKLALNPDGSFTYTPNAGYAGADSFTYKAYDGRLYSDVKTVSLMVWSGTTVTLTKPSTAPAYAGSVKLTAKLATAAGKAISGRSVLFERWDGSKWVSLGSAVTDGYGKAYKYASNLKVKTALHARFVESSPYRASVPSKVYVYPKVKLTRSSSWDTKYDGMTYYYKGYIEPKHSTSDKNKVKFKMYKKGSDGEYHWKKTVTASYSYYSSSKTKWTAKVVFPSAGRWRVRAYHAADSRNEKAYSSYDYVTVK